MAKRNMSEREYLIEQVFADIRYNNGEELNEGWFDSLKANVAGGISGLKQGVKNTARRITDAGRTIKQVGSNLKSGAKAAKNVAMGDKDAAIQNLNNVQSPTANNKGIDNTVKNAASDAKIASFSKSILNTVGSYLKAGGNVEELISAIQELAANQEEPAQQGIDNAENMDQGDAGSEFGDYATSVENEEQINSSYDPYTNTKGQVNMLNSLR